MHEVRHGRRRLLLLKRAMHVRRAWEVGLSLLENMSQGRHGCHLVLLCGKGSSQAAGRAHPLPDRITLNSALSLNLISSLSHPFFFNRDACAVGANWPTALQILASFSRPPLKHHMYSIRGYYT